MHNISIYIFTTFGIALLSTIYFFYKASQQSKGFLILITSWIILQSILGISRFYQVTNSEVPRFQLLLFPPLFIILFLFNTKNGRLFIDNLDLKTLTIIHIIRLPIEVVLYWLFISKAVPQLMTFEGRNFDIIAGISAPIIYYFGFVNTMLNKSILLVWNILCLGLLINIVVNGLLSAPSPFQQFGFEQPNVAILHFPFMFLPACIVPIILFSHLASIRQLLFMKSMIK
jgi:hypothetical protein